MSEEQPNSNQLSQLEETEYIRKLEKRVKKLEAHYAMLHPTRLTSEKQMTRIWAVIGYSVFWGIILGPFVPAIITFIALRTGAQ
jgi:hypothetical protein